jgi:hypothetical protein
MNLNYFKTRHFRISFSNLDLATETSNKMFILTITVIIIITFSCRKDNNSTPDNDYISSMMWDGLKRTYLTHLPPGYKEIRPIPLVLALHGGDGNAEAMVKLTKGGLNTLADEKGIIGNTCMDINASEITWAKSLNAIFGTVGDYTKGSREG